MSNTILFIFAELQAKDLKSSLIPALSNSGYDPANAPIPDVPAKPLSIQQQARHLETLV